LDTALEFVERLKSRNLIDLIEHSYASQKIANHEENEAYEDLREELKAYIGRLNNKQGRSVGTALDPKLIQARGKYAAVAQRFKKRGLSYDIQLNLHISYDEIRNLADSKTAIIEFFPMSDKTVIFVITSDRTIEESTVIIEDYNENQLSEDIIGYSKANADFREKLCSLEEWQNNFDNMMKKLHKKLFLPVKPILSGLTKIIMIPFRGLHLLPLHAMFTENDGQRRYIIDDFLVSYAPSAKMLKKCRERKRASIKKTFLALSPHDDLPFAGMEVDAICNIFHPETEESPDSSILNSVNCNDIVNYGKNAHLFHYAGHANFQSLFLNDEHDPTKTKEYTVGDIFQSLELPDNTLTTLSACETGLSVPGGTDEYIGLPAGFLYAGSSTLISSLWCVNDEATFLLMKKMYLLLKNGHGKAESLRLAQLWLKDSCCQTEHYEMMPENFKKKGMRLINSLDSPYYWAGFICSGAE